LPPLLCLLFCVVSTVLGRLSFTPSRRPLPMVCITNTPFQEIPVARLSKTHKIFSKITDLIVLRTPPNLCTSPTGYLLYGTQAHEIRGHITSRWFSL
jgi:hypothetical protein